MTVNVSPPAPVASPLPPDPLRLSVCPACTYDLAGLPEAGNCPECGAAYDRRADEVFLFGSAAGSFASLTNSSRGNWVGQLVLAGGWPALWLLNYRRGPAGADPAALLVVGLLVAQVVLMVLVRASAPPAGPVRVRLGADGCGQSDTVPETSSLLPLLRWTQFAGLAGFLLYLSTSKDGVGRVTLWFWVGLLVVVSVVTVAQRWLSRGKADRSPGDRFGRRAGQTHPWSDVNDVLLGRTGRGGYRLRLRHKSWVNTWDCVDAELPITPDQADALASRLAGWRGRQ